MFAIHHPDRYFSNDGRGLGPQGIHDCLGSRACRLKIKGHCGEMSVSIAEKVYSPEPHSGQRRGFASVTVNQWRSWESAGAPVHPMIRSVS